MDRETVEKYLDFYSETQGLLPERLEVFGQSYRDQGFLTREQLYEIAYESSTRSAYHVRKNPEERCRTVTGNVLKVEDDFSKIALIEALKGFKAPTASCVVAAFDPENHAVVDTRVWASLERLDYLEGRKESFTASDYVTMMNPIREIADETGYRPVDIGYALFAYDVDKREGTLH
ncbi:hypothetical protein ACK3SF_04060 [Candidatus Nanosalina sp. VS9-1]|uniref:hypothetical protein n=1 Tax=Candidatus Nanosalina sp. VS9-1 TaxID=3388566 RepID=UPI0039E0872B